MEKNFSMCSFRMLLLKTFKIMSPIKYYKYTIFKEKEKMYIYIKI